MASYSIVCGIEAWDKADPRAVAVFRCERHASGRAFPDLVLLQRIPFACLTRTVAEAQLERLAYQLRDRAVLDEGVRS
jgi:hypothetical protein